MEEEVGEIEPEIEAEIKKEVIGNSDNSFTFDTSYNNVFCYGKEVNDFHTLDKNKLDMNKLDINRISVDNGKKTWRSNANDTTMDQTPAHPLNT